MIAAQKEWRRLQRSVCVYVLRGWMWVGDKGRNDNDDE